MASQDIVYDTLGQPTEGNDGGGVKYFSFTSSSTAGNISDLKLSLSNAKLEPNTGTTSVYLLSDNAGSPGAVITQLGGAISDARITQAGSNIVDVPVTSNAPLAANTRYWIEVNFTKTSNAELDFEQTGAGTGTSGEYYESVDAFGQGQGTKYADSTGAFISQVTERTACFVSGTIIETAYGPISVEKLVVGDAALTVSRHQRPIRWLGHRTVDCRNHPRPHEALPIRISAHAFGENRPARDLFVSPGHAICVDIVGEVLIPAGSLVNGSTITQVAVAEVTYWHVELDSHDILLAENLPAESYLEMGNRGFFQEADVVDLAAGPDSARAQRTHADFCRPYVDAGPLLNMVRAQLATRAAVMAADKAQKVA